MIRLSLVIATYNRAEQLMVTLESVALQNAPSESWECLVVDNNSSDNTHLNITKFIESHNHLNIRYIFEPQQGLSYARNAGITAAQGDIIAFIDDDERIVPEFIESYINLFNTTPKAMTAGGRIIAEYPTGRPVWMSHYTERPIANPMSFGDKVMPFPKNRIPGGGNMAVRSEVFQQIGMFDTSLGRTGKRLIGGEESELFERIAEQGMACYYVPNAVIYHIIPEEKLTRIYFTRLAYNIGISQYRRAEIHKKQLSLYVGELAKWCATLLLSLVHRPAQSARLIVMRYHITRGILSGTRG